MSPDVNKDKGVAETADPLLATSEDVRNSVSRGNCKQAAP